MSSFPWSSTLTQKHFSMMAGRQRVHLCGGAAARDDQPGGEAHGRGGGRDDPGGGHRRGRPGQLLRSVDLLLI